MILVPKPPSYKEEWKITILRRTCLSKFLKAFGVEHIDILDVMGGVIFLPGKWTRLIDYLF
jgi:hypothetical protein